MIICYLRVDYKLDDDDFQALKQLLPKNLSQRNDRYLQQIDRQRNLFGLLLLRMMWWKQFNQPLDLEKIESTEFKRPYLPGSMVDFNISHAGDFVICVLGPGVNVGIDIERKKAVDFSDFKRTMNTQQWDEINNSPDPDSKFFEFWCIKESVIKADGRGLSIPLKEIIIRSNTVSYSGNLWHIRPFMINSEHFGCIACDREFTDFQLNEVHWRDLLA